MCGSVSIFLCNWFARYTPGKPSTRPKSDPALAYSARYQVVIILTCESEGYQHGWHVELAVNVRVPVTKLRR